MNIDNSYPPAYHDNVIRGL